MHEEELRRIKLAQFGHQQILDMSTSTHSIPKHFDDPQKDYQIHMRDLEQPSSMSSRRMERNNNRRQYDTGTTSVIDSTMSSTFLSCSSFDSFESMASSENNDDSRSLDSMEMQKEALRQTMSFADLMYYSRRRLPPANQEQHVYPSKSMSKRDNSYSTHGSDKKWAASRDVSIASITIPSSRALTSKGVAARTNSRRHSRPGAYQMMGARVLGRAGAHDRFNDDAESVEAPIDSLYFEDQLSSAFFQDQQQQQQQVQQQREFEHDDDTHKRQANNLLNTDDLTAFADDMENARRYSSVDSKGSVLSGWTTTAPKTYFLIIMTVVALSLVVIVLILAFQTNSEDNDKDNQGQLDNNNNVPVPYNPDVRYWELLLQDCSVMNQINYKSLGINPAFIQNQTRELQRQLFASEARGGGGKEQDIDPCSPQGLALLSISLLLGVNGTSFQSKVNEGARQSVELLYRYSLSTVYFATNGPKWLEQSGWLSRKAPCEWSLVVCSEDQQIKELELFSNSLQGTLPNELFLLTSLENLSLEYNDILGTLSSSISQLSALLHFDIVGTKLSGSLPTELFHLSTLIGMGLPRTIDRFVVPPSYYASLKQLKILRTSTEYLGGTIPPELTQIRNLQSLLIEGPLTGKLPESIARISDLRVFHVVGGFLTGTIPESVFITNTGWKSLIWKDNHFSGSLPTSLGLLNDLETLELGHNDFIGPIPTQVGYCTSLRQLDLRGNRLHGTLPEELGDMKSIEMLRLGDGNSFEGTIPSTLGRLQNLTLIEISDKGGLTGTIPSELCSFSASLNLQCLGQCNSELLNSCTDLPCCIIAFG